VLVNREGRIEVVGLVSWGFKCEAAGLPSVFTKVHFYLDWIQQNIQVDVAGNTFCNS
jgi:secreted trypsin-like serine protease